MLLCQARGDVGLVGWYPAGSTCLRGSFYCRRIRFIFSWFYIWRESVYIFARSGIGDLV